MWIHRFGWRREIYLILNDRDCDSRSAIDERRWKTMSQVSQFRGSPNTQVRHNKKNNRQHKVPFNKRELSEKYFPCSPIHHKTDIEEDTKKRIRIRVIIKKSALLLTSQFPTRCGSFLRSDAILCVFLSCPKSDFYELLSNERRFFFSNFKRRTQTLKKKVNQSPEKKSVRQSSSGGFKIDEIFISNFPTHLFLLNVFLRKPREDEEGVSLNKQFL